MYGFRQTIDITFQHHIPFIVRHFITQQKKLLGHFYLLIFHLNLYFISQLKGFLAKFTDQLFPIITINPIKFLTLFFGVYPFSHALYMDIFHAAHAFAWHDERIF